MPTAIEYGVVHNWHVQNGAGTGPPAANVWHAQNGVGTGPPSHHDATVAQLPFAPAMSAGELLFAGPLALSFLAAALVAAVRRHPHGR